MVHGFPFGPADERVYRDAPDYIFARVKNKESTYHVYGTKTKRESTLRVNHTVLPFRRSRVSRYTRSLGRLDRFHYRKTLLSTSAIARSQGRVDAFTIIVLYKNFNSLPYKNIFKFLSRVSACGIEKIRMCDCNTRETLNIVHVRFSLSLSLVLHKIC